MIKKCKTVPAKHDFDGFKKCPICGFAEKTFIYRHTNGTTEVMCNRCGQIYLTKVSNDVYKLYRNFRQTYPEQYLLNKNNSPFKIATQRIRTLYNTVKNNISSLMEIGCGYGHFLSLFSNKVYKVGIEPSQAEASFADKYFHINELWNCYFENIPSENLHWPADGFDLICSFHTIEHTSKPLKLIKFMETYLGENGYIFLAVPNVLTLRPNFIDLLFLRNGLHLHIFNPYNVLTLLKKIGLTIISYGEESATLPDSSFFVIAQKIPSNKNKNINFYNEHIQNIYTSIKRFHKRVDILTKNIDAFIKKAHSSGKKIAIYGGGFHTISLLSNLKNKKHIYCIVDDDPSKEGKRIDNIPILRLKKAINKVDIFLVSSWASEDKILSKLSGISSVKSYGIYKDMNETEGIK